MKHILFITICLVQASLALATVTIDAQFSGVISAQAVKLWVPRRDIRCELLKRKSEETDFGIVNSHLEAERRSIQTTGQEVWFSEKLKTFNRSIRQLTLKTHISEVDGATSVNFLLTDSYKNESQRFYRDRCHEDWGQSFPRSASFDGELKIHYRVPSNVWLLKFQRTEFNGIFQENSIQGFEGALQTEIENLSKSFFFVWVKPDTDITLNLRFTAAALSNKELFNFGYKIEPIVGSLVNLAELTSLSLQFDQLNFTNVDASLNERYLRSLVGLFGPPENLEKALGQFDITKSIELSDLIFRISNKPINNIYYGALLKISGMLAAYQLSVGILKELSTYCRNIEALSPYSNETIKTNKLRVATFWLKHSLTLLNSDPFGQYEEILAQLAESERLGLTWTQLRKQHKDVLKLNQAFRSLSKYSPLVSNTLDRASLGMNRFLESIKDDSYHPELANLIPPRITELQLMERGFIAHFKVLESLFRRGDASQIELKDIKRELASLKNGRLSIEAISREKIRIHSLILLDERGDIFSKMNKLLSYQVKFLITPSRSPSIFANLQIEFLKAYQSDELIKIIEACIAGETI